MADKVLDAGHSLTVYNRTAAKAAPFVERGAVLARTPGEVASASDVVITMVTDQNALADLVYGPTGILDNIEPNTVFCDMSTVAPPSARVLSERCAERGVRFVQAPVLGSTMQIKSSTLLVLAGGDQENIALCEPVWTAFSSKKWLFPTHEQASAAKLACNMLIAHMTLGLGQSLLFAGKFGVSGTTLLEIIDSSALACSTYRAKGKQIVDRNFTPNFIVKNLLKDLNLAMDSAARDSIPQPFASLAQQIFASAVAQGYGDEDYCATVKVLEGLAGATIGK
jgi:3-hydroxyisobutyrate dehydrogenase-like beta-hydroxyacid dehydrogenase